MNVAIVVVESGGNSDVTVISPYHLNDETQIVIGHIGQMHYVATEEERYDDDGEELESPNVRADVQNPTSSRLEEPKWKTSIWGEASSDGFVVRNSCPIDGSLTFFCLLMKFAPPVEDLFKTLAEKDPVIATLLQCKEIALSTKGKTYGDAKVHWLSQTGHISQEHSLSSSSYNAWGSEYDRFFESFLNSAACAVEAVLRYRCSNDDCRKPITERKRRNVMMRCAASLN